MVRFWWWNVISCRKGREGDIERSIIISAILCWDVGGERGCTTCVYQWRREEVVYKRCKLAKTQYLMGCICTADRRGFSKLRVCMCHYQSVGWQLLSLYRLSIDFLEGCSIVETFHPESQHNWPSPFKCGSIRPSIGSHCLPLQWESQCAPACVDCMIGVSRSGFSGGERDWSSVSKTPNSLIAL